MVNRPLIHLIITLHMLKRVCFLTFSRAKALCLFAPERGSLLTFAVAGLLFKAVGQSATPFPSTPAAHTIHQYQTAFGKAIQLYNGAEYIRPFPLIKGSPFLEASGPQKGSVYFDGIFYPDVMLTYDVVNQQLVTTGYQNINIILVPEKIGYFYLSDRLFVPAPQDSLTNKKPFPGFCEVLYNQRLSVLAHYQKTPKRSSNTESATTLNQYTTYFILKDNNLTEIKNEKTLLAAFKAEKENVKQFLRTNNLSFKKAPAETLLKAAAYVNQLND